VHNIVFPAENGMTEFGACVAYLLPFVRFKVITPALLVSDKDEKEIARLSYLVK